MSERSYGAGSGTSRHYIVEARSTSDPKVVTERFVLDHEWRQIPTCGKPEQGISSLNWNALADQLRLMDHTCALAIAHTFLAQLNATIMGALCVEVRLVEVQLDYSYSTKEIGVGPIINRTDGEREKFVPREAEPIPLTARVPKEKP
jgi:hypothetical protein